MTLNELQELCESGQRELMATNYLSAEKILAAAERIAFDQREFETLSRLYMPLQEARRQRRQRCGEGTVHLGLIAKSPDDKLSAEQLINQYPFGQLLIAGWATIEPAQQFRRLQFERNLYVDTFLAAVFPTTAGPIIAILPEASPLPPPNPQSLDQLRQLLPPHTLFFYPHQLPSSPQTGTYQTYSHVMQMWESLHTPFLSFADSQQGPLQKIEQYRHTIRIDYACELAHQKLAAVAARLAS
ncbi:MAG TPA: hypothetical protein VGQ99_23620 [Tepidisphaeraceae bacterium]|jgi:hypothetical protein|nr:hypothetical protein [Tepidisphaeraceae bacterium]